MRNGNVPSYKVPKVPYFYQHWLEDPFVPKNMPIRSYLENFNEVMRIQEASMQKITLPTLLIQGGQDKISSNFSSKKVFQSLPMNDKNIITYDDCDHHMLADGEWVDIIANDTISW